MREIKFRAWIDNKMCIEEIWSWQDFATCLFDKPEAIIMQFTGLKDKNGKEIYEGDILLEECDGAVPFVIEWEQEQWVEDGFVSGFTCLCAGANCYTVIGNIYETPELLEAR